MEFRFVNNLFKKKKLFWIGIILLFAIGIVREIGRDNFEIYIHNNQLIYLEETDANSGLYIPEKQEFFDPTYGYPAQYTSEEMRLEKGNYEIAIRYVARSEDATAYIYSYSDRYGDISADYITLEKNATKVEFEIELHQNVSDFQIRINEHHKDDIEIQNIEIRSIKHIGKAICNFVVILALIWTAVLVGGNIYKKRYSYQQIQVLFGLSVIVSLASMTLAREGIVESIGFEDLSFHLWRIEGIAEGLLNGTFPVRVQPLHLNGYGYPNGIYYGDILLYFPAVLRRLGYTITESYKAYVLLINVASAYAAYWGFRKISNNYQVGLFASALLTLAPYRLVNVYDRAAVGEYTAMVFMPLVICGLWMISHSETYYTAKEGRMAVIIGCSGIIQSHILSVLIMCIGGMLILTIMILAEGRNRIKNIFKHLFSSMSWVVLLNLWYIVPFFDYMLTQHVKVNDLGINKIQKRGIELSDLGATILGDTMIPRSLGVAFLVIILCYISMILWAHYNTINLKYRNEMNGIMMVTAMLIFMTLKCFPYDFLCKNSTIINQLIGKIQFPWRWLGIIGLFLAVIMCLVLINLFEKNTKFYVSLSIGIAGIIIGQGIQIQSCIINATNDVKYYDTEGLYQDFLHQVYQGEYLLINTVQEDLKYDKKIYDYNNVLWETNREGTTFTLTIDNKHDQEAVVDLPVLCYKGYEARDVHNGKKLALDTGENNRLRIIVPGEYSGEVKVEFTGMWYWKIAEIISILSIIIIILIMVILKRYIRIINAKRV